MKRQALHYITIQYWTTAALRLMINNVMAAAAYYKNKQSVLHDLHIGMRRMLMIICIIIGIGTHYSSSLSSSSSSKLMMNELDITWGGDKAKIDESGQTLTLSLDKFSGSGFQSKNLYLFAKIDMQLKLVPGNSAGTVTSYYLQSEGSPMWDEIDFEFLGNLSGDPYTVHTNVYTQGKGEKEQQFHLWFDPTQDFHTYSILWNPYTIIFYVDNIPIREFKNLEKKGVGFPKGQAMRLHSTLWNADDWATRGGLIKTDWTHAPFFASYRNFTAQACISPISPGMKNCDEGWTWMRRSISPKERQKMEEIQRSLRIYHYCNDAKRFPTGFPIECVL